jgi:hypothetical protein
MMADMILSLLGLLAAYWLVSGLVELHIQRRRRRAWWRDDARR